MSRRRAIRGRRPEPDEPLREMVEAARVLLGVDYGGQIFGAINRLKDGNDALRSENRMLRERLSQIQGLAQL